MKHAARPLSFLLRVVPAVLLALTMAAAHADDYSDVNGLLRQGKSDEALTKADAYIAGKPRDPQMRFLRGVILTEQKKQADAIAAFTQLTQDFPELPEPYNNLAALYAAQSEFDKARAALEMAIKLNPSYATAHENLGDVYVRLAAQSYSRAQQLEPGNTTVPPKLVLIRQMFDAPASGTLPPAPAVIRKPVRGK
ncbi:putative PEP-CTERM system TPR-repeat lipoprotein [Variovorax sp. SRS16]|uniref:tetratricopeptide repeat protein n=1 Tax=Variovorax sp. SRS16 TaxID=282217 RepID=UPI001317CF68|nr:tetratricopeptide repeat protein [Variovorax sp. SRS16]VTU18568.1 putative PEP-CTERM system TPR-repeat lipoprotein [Variovorax sp. SRS16]